jgi:hypothetical protein
MGDSPKYLLLLLGYGRKFRLSPAICRIQGRPALWGKIQTISCHYWLMVRNDDRMSVFFLHE